MEQFIGFWDLTKEQQERLAADGMLNIRTFGKRQVLMNQDDDADNVGVMLSGTAFLESMNQEGQRRILDYYEPKESFTRKCFPDVEGVCYVISRSSCQVAFLNDRKLSSAYKKYEKRPAHYQQQDFVSLVKELFKVRLFLFPGKKILAFI